MKYIGYIFCLILIGTGFSCANYGNLSGGPKDLIPPRMLLEKSTPLNQTQFRPTEIKLVFDEWINLEDQHKQILISPPLKKPVNYTVKGKSLYINFDKDEVLMDSSTYVIQFGKSIIDITERNAVTNMNFVFSTGDVIDSLEFEGLVLDAWTKKPIEGVNVMLYDQLEDSLPYKQKPNFVVRTDAFGKFNLQNLRADSFKIFALEDNNLNYLYDLDIERVAFHTAPIYTLDSTNKKLILMLSGKTVPNEIGSKTIWSNVIRASFEQKPENINFHFEDQLASIHSWHKDSLYIWLNDTIKQDNKLIFVDKYGMNDTVDISLQKIRNIHSAPLRILNNLELQNHLNKSWTLEMNQPMIIQVDSIILMDTMQIPRDSFSLLQDSNHILWHLKYNWNSELNYKLKLPPGTIKGNNEQANPDTITLDLRIKKLEGLGNIIAHLSTVDTSIKHLVVRLEKGEKLEEKKIVEVKDSTTQVNFDNLQAGNYQLRIVYDDNGSGRWDPGNYEDHIQPEEIQIETMQPLRANWDLDVKIDLVKASTMLSEIVLTDTISIDSVIKK